MLNDPPLDVDNTLVNLPKVLLTNPIHPDASTILAKRCEVVVATNTSQESLRQAAADADGIIVRAQLPEDLFQHATRLRGIVRHGVGVDFIPVAEATKRGVPVANLPGSNSRAVAEYVFAALFYFRRFLAGMDAKMRDVGWHTARALSDDYVEIGGEVLGIIGGGAIGSRVAEIGARGFGMKVLCNSRRPTTLGDLAEPVDLPTLFDRSGVVVVACPLNDDTRGLIGSSLIKRMRQHCVLINVARGPIVVVDALLAALRNGDIAGAALDVFERQPLVRTDAVFDAPNLLITPHAASLTRTSNRAMGLGAVEEMLRMLDGLDPVGFVNPGCRD
jgi:D-3-phosphoglycerate dehydrogenase / 2-oxoglutarate reductase